MNRMRVLWPYILIALFFVYALLVAALGRRLVGQEQVIRGGGRQGAVLSLRSVAQSITQISTPMTLCVRERSREDWGTVWLWFSDSSDGCSAAGPRPGWRLQGGQGFHFDPHVNGKLLCGITDPSSLPVQVEVINGHSDCEIK